MNKENKLSEKGWQKRSREFRTGGRCRKDPEGVTGQRGKFIVSFDPCSCSNGAVLGTGDGRNMLKRRNFRRVMSEKKNGRGCPKSLWWLHFGKEGTEVILQRTKEGKQA